MTKILIKFISLNNLEQYKYDFQLMINPLIKIISIKHCILNYIYNNLSIDNIELKYNVILNNNKNLLDYNIPAINELIIYYTIKL